MRRALCVLAGCVLVLLGVGCATPDDASQKPPAENAPGGATTTTGPTAATLVEASPSIPTASAPPLFESPMPGADDFVVIYTASVQGYVAPCGCTGEPLGGVARLGRALDEAKAAYGGRVLFLDAGDLLFERTDDTLAADKCQTEARHNLLLSSYASFGLQATVRGPLDDVRGKEWRDGLLKTHGVSSVSTFDDGADGSRAAGTSRVVNVGATKVGIVGVTLGSDTKLEKARAALTKEVAKLTQKGATVIVLLAQTHRLLTASLVQDLPIDLVIQGREPGELPVSPERVGPQGPLVVAAGIQAQHVGIVEFAVTGREGRTALAVDDREGQVARRRKLLTTRIKQYEKQLERLPVGKRRTFIESKFAFAKDERENLSVQNVGPAPSGPRMVARAAALTRARKARPDLQAALTEYEKSIPELVSRCEDGIVCAQPKKGEARYVGAQTCAECHGAAVKFWQRQHVSLDATDDSGTAVKRIVGHHKAWQTLVHDSKERDRTCVGCHSVGFNEPGGYCRTSDVGFLEGVQCESCHGPGSNHVESSGDPALLARPKPDENLCRTCHHVPHIPSHDSFVFDEKLRYILGPGHGAIVLKNKGLSFIPPSP